MAMPHAQEIEGYILDGMARALWVHAYMIWATEVEPPPTMGGQTWDEQSPNNASTRAASGKAAAALVKVFREANRRGGASLVELFRETQHGGRVAGGGTEADRAYAFGEDVALACLGTRDLPTRTAGVLHARSVALPSFSVDLDDDGQHMSWDGGVTWEGRMRNPGDKMEVLVVEDDEQLKKMYPRLIRKIFPGAIVDVEDTYNGAISRLVNQPRIGLVISDVNIVGAKTGIDVFEWVKKHKPHLVDKYVFVTGGNPQVAQMHYRYIEKPLMGGAEQLREMIERPAPAAGAGRTSAPPTPAPSGMDLATFAAAVQDALPSVHEESGPTGHPRGRYGPDKVFVAGIWRQLEADPRFAGMDLPQFKRRLVAANRHRLVDLARADLVGAMDPAEVRVSEIEDMGATFHFVVPRSPRRNPCGSYTTIGRNPGYRAPTDAELAAALYYIQHEFRLRDGRVTGEHWAEGLAFGDVELRPGDGDDLAQARHMRGQLPGDQWMAIAARADELRAEQGDPPRFR